MCVVGAIKAARRVLRGVLNDRFRGAAARGALQEEEAAGQHSCVVGAGKATP